ncbi:putative mfs multidrug resistance protein [Botrytis fragariae]|uniref:Putative mfs multidrug resistance protein n=1 Tax=Botrytis fragariae TaxID=1964551 RepID=A0A8H6AL21_9HELO|nr:putative mfs multidrug resistance protein [Botrytis fragariae]KAF5869561.1 putative mfs multidrug resistance protein [Botrytis fragariae]
MVVDEEKAETSRALPQEIHAPRTTATRDVEPNKELESPNESTNPALVRPEISPSEGLNPALEHIPTPMVVPRSKRRGLLGLLTIIPEVENPQNYKNGTKWLITFIVAVAGAAAPLGSAIFFPALTELSEDFHASKTLTNLAVAMYLLAMSIFPLWWSAFSEIFGRRTICLISFALFTLWSAIAAISTSMAMLIVMRVLGGGAAASVLAIGAGTIADIWEPKERGRAMGIFFLGPMLGPLLAPIIGGAVAEKWGWRSTQWFQTIYGGVLLILLLFCLPETLTRRAPVVEELADGNITSHRPNFAPLPTSPSIQHRMKRMVVISKQSIIDPLKILGYLRFSAVSVTVYIGSITFGSLYILNIAIQKTFGEEPYEFSEVVVGLTYIPGSLGYIVAGFVGGKWSDAIMHREARAAGRFDESGKLILRPEDRMRENVLLAAAIYPAGLLWFGWTAEEGVYWIVPLIANFFFGFGTMIIFSTATTMSVSPSRNQQIIQRTISNNAKIGLRSFSPNEVRAV